MKNNNREFWITNVSKRDVSLRDLALTIRSYRSMNLLDSKHFVYTLEQLEASAQTGSLAAKSDKIKIRQVAPKIAVKPGLYVQNEPRGFKPRSQVVIIEKRLEDLLGDDDSMMSDQKFALEFVDDEELKNPNKK